MPGDVTIGRAARLADGFKMMAPLGTDLDGMLRLVDRLRDEVAAAGRDAAAFGIEGRLVTHVTPPEQWAANVRGDPSGRRLALRNRQPHRGRHCRRSDRPDRTRVADVTRAEWGEA